MFQEDLTIDEVLADPLILQVMRADGITAYQLRGLLEEVRDRTCKSEPSKLRTRDSDRVRESWQLDTVGRPRKCIATKHNLKTLRNTSLVNSCPLSRVGSFAKPML